MNIIDYHNRDEISSTNVRDALKSGKHYFDRINGPASPSTRAMDEGSAVHACIGEPDIFAKEFVFRPAGLNLNSKDGRAWKKENEGKIILTSEFEASLKLIQNALRQSPAVDFYNSKGKANADIEKDFFWEIAGNNRGGKCRPDWISKDRKTIVDLKTTQAADKGSFQRSIVNYGYHIQAAWYMWGVEQATGIKPEEFIFVVIEKTRPFGIGVYKADHEMLGLGSAECMKALELINEWEKKEQFPGYCDQIETITLPPWMRLKGEKEVTPQNYHEIELY